MRVGANLASGPLAESWKPPSPHLRITSMTTRLVYLPVALALLACRSSAGGDVGHRHQPHPSTGPRWVPIRGTRAVIPSWLLPATSRRSSPRDAFGGQKTPSVTSRE